MITGDPATSDQRAREVAQLEVARPGVLIAGAGTGKTTTLVHRLVVWALGEGWNRHAAVGSDLEVAGRVLQRITCMTFTEKAAGEMSLRFGEMLSLALSDPQKATARGLRPGTLEGTEWRGRAEALRAQAHMLRASTIHAFCQRVLREHAVVAGLPPAFVIDKDGERIAAIAGEVFFAWWQRPEQNAHLRTLLGQGLDPRELLDALQVLVAGSVTPDELARMRCSREDILIILNAAIPLLTQLESELPPITSPSKRRGKLTVVIAPLSALAKNDVRDLSFLSGSSFHEALKALSGIAKELGVAESKHLENSAVDVQVRAAELHAQLSAIADCDPRLLDASKGLLRPLLETTRERARREGVLRFDDLLMETSRLLREQPQVALLLAKDMDQLMLDEVQDTDPCQYGIVNSIIDAAGGALGVFVIGDPKQCIYTFRNADLGALRAFLEGLERRRAVSHSLTRNFRSEAPILEAVAALMHANMVPVLGHQPAFEPLVPHTKHISEFGSAAVAVEYWDTSPAADMAQSARAAREREALAVAEDILRIQAADAAAGRAITPWREFMVLMRSLPDQGIYLNALRKAGIPVTCEQERDWHQRREVLDTIAALLCVLDSEDEVALLGFLRSPHVGLPDAAVPWIFGVAKGREGKPSAVRSSPAAARFRAAMRASEPDAASHLREALKFADSECERALGAEVAAEIQGWSMSVQCAVEHVLELRVLLSKTSVAEFLAEFRKRLQLEETEAARELGWLRVGAVTEVLQHAERWLLDGHANGAVAVMLRDMLSGDRKRESRVPSDPEEDAVRVLSVHKAKGLEADVVYFVDLSRKAPQGDGRERDVVRRWRPSDGREADVTGRACAFKLLGFSDLDQVTLKEAEEQREEHELVRLLYVASTRARKRLVLSAQWDEAYDAEGEAKKLKGRFLGLLREAVGISRGHVLHTAELPGGVEELRSMPEAADSAVAAHWRSVSSRIAAHSASTRRLEPIALQVAQELSCAVAKPRPLTLAISSLGTHTAKSARNEIDPANDDSEQKADAGELARKHGTQMHKAMELWDAAADPKAEAERILGLLGTVSVDTAARIRELPEKQLLPRFREISSRIVAREFPLVAQDAENAVLALIGTVDMIYRDTDGSIVIVDYKTDKTDKNKTDELKKTELFKRHSEQLGAYERAVRAAMPGEQVRWELWSFDLDAVIRGDEIAEAPSPN